MNMREIVFKKALSNMVWDHRFWEKQGKGYDGTYEERRDLYKAHLSKMTDQELFTQYEINIDDKDYWPQA